MPVKQIKAVIAKVELGSSIERRHPEHAPRDGRFRILLDPAFVDLAHRGNWSMHSLLEVAFGLYFVVTIGLAIATGNYISVPFLILFMVGFLYVGGLSLYQTR